MKSVVTLGTKVMVVAAMLLFSSCGSNEAEQGSELNGEWELASYKRKVEMLEDYARVMLGLDLASSLLSLSGPDEEVGTFLDSQKQALEALHLQFPEVKFNASVWPTTFADEQSVSVSFSEVDDENTALGFKILPATASRLDIQRLDGITKSQLDILLASQKIATDVFSLANRTLNFPGDRLLRDHSPDGSSLLVHVELMDSDQDYHINAPAILKELADFGKNASTLLRNPKVIDALNLKRGVEDATIGIIFAEPTAKAVEIAEGKRIMINPNNPDAARIIIENFGPLAK